MASQADEEFSQGDSTYEIDRNDYGHARQQRIHNYAAYRVMTARAAAHLFKASELAALFYIALTQHLSRTSLFTDSRRAVVRRRGRSETTRRR